MAVAQHVAGDRSGAARGALEGGDGGGRYWDDLSYMQDNNQVFQVWMDSKRLIQLP
jgi:hypothetical protein